MPETVVNLPGEIWKPVVGFEGLYEVSNMGRVKALRKKRLRVYPEKVLKAGDHEFGYKQVSIYRNGKQWQASVHRLVLLAFVGPPPEGAPWACHNNGDPADNRLENLRWDTPAGNHADKSAHGTWQGGENNPAAKLTEQDVLVIRELSAEGLGQRKIARMFGVAKPTVKRILSGKTWSHV